MSMLDIRREEYLLSYFSKLFSSIVEEIHFYKAVVLLTLDDCFFLYNEAISFVIKISLERKASAPATKSEIQAGYLLIFV